MQTTTSSEQAIAELSAPKLHELAQESFRIGNRGRLTLGEVLRRLAESRLYHELGYPSVVAYAAAHFQLRRSETHEAVRVARALETLTDIRAAFADGALSWSVVKAITRVATEATEGEWIEFAASHTVGEILAEVRDARRNGRDRPADERYGLPNLDERLVLRFSRSQMEKVRLALSALGAEAAERSGREDCTPEEVLLFVCEHILESGGWEKTPPGSTSGERRYALVYHACPSCERSGLHSDEGLIEVEREEVERIAGSAHVEVIAPVAAADAAPSERDRPTPPALRRKVLLRDGVRCANPRCDHAAEHCHHIVFLSEGGRTVLENEVAVCATCHALIHAGLLRVEGKAGTALRWSACGDSLRARVRREGARADGLPVLRLESASADPSSTRSAAGTAAQKSAYADFSSGAKLDLDLLATGLVRQGFPKRAARESVQRAAEALPAETLSEAAVLRMALTMGGS